MVAIALQADLASLARKYGDLFGSRKKVRLTNRETEIRVFASQCLSANEITAKMCVTSDTVKFHRKNLFEKLEVVNISQAVAVATSYKLV